MAWVPRGGANFSILDDGDSHTSSSSLHHLHHHQVRQHQDSSPGPFDSHRSSASSVNYVHHDVSNPFAELNPFAALKPIDPNHAQNQGQIDNRPTPSPAALAAADSLAEELRKFHIADDHPHQQHIHHCHRRVHDDEDDEPEEEEPDSSSVDSLEGENFPRLLDPRSPTSKGRGLRSRPPIEANTFHAPETIQEEDENADPGEPGSPISPKSVETIRVANGKDVLRGTFSGRYTRAQQIRRALDHKFDIFVRLPTSEDSERTVCYGCNILPRSEKNLGRDTYSVIGRPVEDPRQCSSPPESPLVGKGSVTTTTTTTPASFDSKRPGKMISRIEDSLEAIDQLEEQLESFGRVANLERVSPPVSEAINAITKARIMTESPKSLEKVPSASSTPRKSVPMSSSPAGSRFNTVNPSTLQAAKRASMTFGVDDKTKSSSNNNNNAGATRKPTLVRTGSLREMKGKSSKPLTVPSFELPGEAIARKLKEQREARKERSSTSEQATIASATGLVRVRSTKPLTRPNFELPGDAISRRKREEREARLKAQEEEDKKKREFKAKPMRTTSVRSSYPKETVASRARQQAKAAVAAAASLSGSSHPKSTDTTPNKRLTVATRTPLSAGTAASLSPRGRSSIGNSSPTTNTSRAASTSTGSVSGKRSAVSTEEHNYQKKRGKEVYARDSQYSEDRERERRERELAAKLARQEAAERSRQASRDWAEKQRQKKIGPSGPSPAPSHHVVVS